MSRPYSIVTPQFDVTSGGIRVLWGLYGALLAKGQIAFVNATFDNKDFVAIYSDIHRGNQTGANTVVRYLLNKPGVMSSGGMTGDTTFAPTDKIYYFSRLFGNTDDAHYMFLPILDMHTFCDQGKKRKRTAVLVGKGVDHKLHPTDSIYITREFAKNQQALADLLNECEVLYCYDPVTAMTEIARLCGCRVVMINDVYTKKEFEKYEPGMNGISWGVDEMVKLDTKSFTQRYTEMKWLFNQQLDDFIDATQS